MPTIECDGDATLNLTTALLIYESPRNYDRSANEVVVTQHAVTKGMIQPGAPLDLAAFRKLIDRGGEVAAASRQSDYAWQFPRLLAESKEHIVWWSPAQFQSVFIGREDAKKPRVIKAWIPPLIWCASRLHTHCYLWAYDGDGAPSPSTSVYRPAFGPADPGLNHIHEDSSVCVGSTKVEGHTPEAWERGFWSSRFKVPGNLKRNQPYACKEIFKSLGSLTSVLPRSGAAD